MSIKANYHSHTALSGHGEGTVEEHIIEMIRVGYDIIGISEHIPLPIIEGFPPKFVLENRMELDALDSYINDLKRCQKKYKNQAKILIGLEAEYFSSHLEYMKTLSQKIDYLVFGNHDIVIDGKAYSSFNLTKDEEVLEYGRNAVEALSTGLFSIMTHPDLFLLTYPWNAVAEEVAHMIARASIKYDVPLELNARGIRRGLVDTIEGIRYKFPRKEFWEIIREYNCEVIINSDAHFIYEHDDDELHIANTLGFEWGLNIIYSLE